MRAFDIVLRPRDPLLVRDGRPFGRDPGARAESLHWPLPSTIAGALRTFIGPSAMPPFKWDGDGPERALRVPVRGPLMVATSPGGQWKVHVPRPLDTSVVCEPDDRVVFKGLRPAGSQPAGWSNLPASLLPMAIEDDRKQQPGFDWWPLESLIPWMAGRAEFPPSEECHAGPAHETRVHVAVDSATLTARESALFSTISLDFMSSTAHRAARASRYGNPGKGPRQGGRTAVDLRRDGRDRPQVAMLCRFLQEEGAGSPETGNYLPLGGERRVSLVEDPVLLGVEWPRFPSAIGEACRNSARLRLQLVTPALFSGGWRPGWLDGNLEGSPPGAEGLRVKLVSAVIGRRVPISGWDMRKGKGPKAARYAVPAGSVYYFESIDAAGSDGSRLWLESLCDELQDRHDGFGIALPGTWSYADRGEA